jgi:hypothetical protein
MIQLDTRDFTHLAKSNAIGGTTRFAKLSSLGRRMYLVPIGSTDSAGLSK